MPKEKDLHNDDEENVFSESLLIDEDGKPQPYHPEKELSIIPDHQEGN